MSSKLLKADLKYLVFSEIYTRLEEPKARRKAFMLLESAIQCFARKGFDGVTLEMIAREAGVTRPLLKHYFENLNDIELCVLKYIRLIFQKIAVDAMSKATEPKQMLSEYVKSCIYWVENYRTHSLVWLSFLHRCGRNPKHAELNTLAVKTGEERIATLLDEGKKQGVFQFENSQEVAVLIQLLITGTLIKLVSEEVGDTALLKKLLPAHCLQFAGAKV